MSLELKQMLVDALSMMERAEVIDFNGHMSCRAAGTDRVLINSGKSVRSALGVEDVIEIDMDGRPGGNRGRASPWNSTSTPRSTVAPRRERRRAYAPAMVHALQHGGGSPWSRSRCRRR
jgi:hypothetical protein